MTVELLYFDGCSNHESLLLGLGGLFERNRVVAEIELRRVESIEQAERERFLGSPSVRVDGRDVEPGAESREDFGLKCRLYRTEKGLVGMPPDEWVLAALGGNPPTSAKASAPRGGSGSPRRGSPESPGSGPRAASALTWPRRSSLGSPATRSSAGGGWIRSPRS